jgi:transcriptional regulator with XRE-family HTH domain
LGCAAICGKLRAKTVVFGKNDVFDGWRVEMQGFERDNLRRELDEEMLPFRLARSRKTGKAGRRKRGRAEVGWLRSIRQAVGLPAVVVAERLGVRRWEVHRLENSESDQRIMLSSLIRAARGLGCELVYALIPIEGTLEEMAAKQRDEREWALRDKRKARELEKKPWLEAIGFREKFQNAIRTMLRRDGVRVRPRKTERGVAKQMAEFKETMKLAAMAGKMGPLMRESPGQRVGDSAGQQVSESADRKAGE